MEWYRYPPGPPVVLPSHTHDEYQLNLNPDLPGGYRYRGALHVVPAGSITVIMPGEADSPRDCGAREDTSSHLTLYIRPGTLGEAAGAMAGSGGRSARQPRLLFFHELIINDPGLARRFTRLHAKTRRPSSPLEWDVSLLALLTRLAERHAGIPAVPGPQAHRAVQAARDYLHGNPAANVSLAELAGVAELSPYRLTRLFTASVGVPPHSYQIQLRVDRAKRLLLDGWAVSDAGHEAGFFDQSHFTRHFRRYVGVPPGRYARAARETAGKIVHSAPRRPWLPSRWHRPIRRGE